MNIVCLQTQGKDIKKGRCACAPAFFNGNRSQLLDELVRLDILTALLF